MTWASIGYFGQTLISFSTVYCTNEFISQLDFDTPIEAFLPPPESNYNMIVSYECLRTAPQKKMMSGTMMLRNSELSRKFLSVILAQMVDADY